MADTSRSAVLPVLSGADFKVRKVVAGRVKKSPPW